MKTSPNAIPLPVAPIEAHALDAAIERTRFDEDTARRAEVMSSAQEAHSVQVGLQFMKNMPRWLRAKLLKQP